MMHQLNRVEAIDISSAPLNKTARTSSTQSLALAGCQLENMRGLLYLAILALLTRVHSHVIAGDKHMIIGGDDAEIKDYPYQVLISGIDSSIKKEIKVCGGGVIGKKWIISAAHCFVEDGKLAIPVSNIQVIVEYSRPHPKPHRVNVTARFAHPQFKSIRNDIALFKLAEELKFSEKIGKLTLPKVKEEYEYVGKEHKVTISRYGRTAENSTEITFILKAAQVNMLDDKLCETVPVYDLALVGKELAYDSKIHICAGTTDGSGDTCKGDSGGPLVYKKQDKNILLGIVSLGGGCGRPGVPGVYTRVSSYLDWIYSTIRENH